MEEKKAKRKYTRRAKVEPLAVYSVLVRVKQGRKTETIYGESTRTENGCLVIVSMDGPQPLVEKTRYIPLGGAEIEVCQRPQPAMRWMAPAPQSLMPIPANAVSLPNGGYSVPTSGPMIQPGPLGLMKMPQRTASNEIVERNGEGAAVVTTGYLEGAPT